jgi:uncharacterized protein (DUF58 family)
VALTGRAGLLALAGVLVVGAAAPSWAGVLAVTAVLLALVAVDVALAASVRALVLRREGDSAVRLGETARVTLAVHNPGRRRLRGLLRDAWPPSAGAVDPRKRVDVPTGERRLLTTTLRPTRRGDRPAHRVTVRALGPLGLAGRQGSHDVPWRLRVLPPFTSRKHLPAKLARLRELDGRTLVMVRGQGSEFDSLREYVPGDDVRSIDWRASARAQDVVVRTWRPERDRHVLIVLDTSRTSAGRVGDAPRLDASLDAALLLAALASRAGDRVDLLAYDRRPRARVEGVSRTDLLPSLVDAMAPLEPELVEADAAGMVSAVLARAPRRSLVVLFTGLDAAPVEEALLPVLPPLVRRHQLVVAAVADPAVDAMAGGRDDTDAVYAAAAAERARLDRARVSEALARHGIEVVDEAPETLAPALADRYLALKAAGRL